MRRTSNFFDLGLVRVERSDQIPLFRQIYESIRSAILSGRLNRGASLPSTRELANHLGVSRMTTVSAYDQLYAEGYLSSIRGSGTFVSKELPEEKQRVQFQRRSDHEAPEEESARTKTLPAAAISKSGRLCVEQGSELGGFVKSTRPFRPGIPAIDCFPLDTWTRLSRARLRQVSAADLSYGEVAGYRPLRESVAKYVSAFRGVRCDVSQVMMVSGTQQAIDLTGRLLLGPGDRVLFENPGYRTARAALIAQGARIVAMPVDSSGARICERSCTNSNARLAYVTPSHQFPLGVTMSVERRMELIAWARKSNALIIEDDYDSEFRYSQRPIPSLQGLDGGGHTIYIGSFAKVVFPALSLGYVVLPPRLVSAFETALKLAGRPPSIVDQMILNDFIEQGHFGRHLRRTRKICQERRTTVVNAIKQNLDSQLELFGSDAGLHCTALIRNGVLGAGERDNDIARRISETGVFMRSLSEYQMPMRFKKYGRQGLIFGFASSTPKQIESAMVKVASVFQ